MCTKEQIQEAKQYLSEQGYRTETNITLNAVANLMAEWLAKKCIIPDVMFSLLKNAKCPDCDGSGTIVVETMRTGTRWVDDGNGNPLPEPVPEPDYDIEPCRWCYERDSLLSNET